jgi:hypothetical protein
MQSGHFFRRPLLQNVYSGDYNMRLTNELEHFQEHFRGRGIGLAKRVAFKLRHSIKSESPWFSGSTFSLP